ncbi:unnamed protein product [Caenorhabditis bovis]|uniref:Uncharacterized protein n=1 Tax=Caenorhabditis bovis TaxID=2654633 RepID=A0A8S1F8H2_9PELO|nr:unnamed protein product [Caenorhabditis bovis]
MSGTGIRYAIANHNFDEQSVADDAEFHKKLDLYIGDRVCVYGELDGWAYGKKFDVRDEWGIFPVACLKFVDKPICASVTDGTLVIAEISRVLNEWWKKIKEIMLKSTDVPSIDVLMESFNELMIIKRKLENGGLPIEELNSLRLTVANLVDRGNMLLGLDVIIRDEFGVPQDAEKGLTLLTIYETHISSQKRVSNQLKNSHENSLLSGSFSLLLSIKSVELNTKHSCEVSIVLYDMEKKMFTTDAYVFLWNPSTGKQRDLNLRALFADFNKNDVDRKIVMITRVVHIAPIDNPSSTIKRHGGDAVIPQSYFCRQAYAFDVLNVSSIFQQKGPLNEAKERVIFLNKDQDLGTALKSLQLTNRIPKSITSELDTSKLLISTQLIPGTSAEIKTRQPHLFSRSPAVMLRRADRTAISIEEFRNEMYVTLIQGEFCDKSSDRNIEARLHVVESNGNVVTNAFETMSVTGSRLGTVYKSVVLYRTDKPQWVEPIKINLPKTASHDLFLRILLYSRKPYDKSKSEKGPFSIAHVQLIRNAALIGDGEHELAVYKENTSYMCLPATKKTIKESMAGGHAKPHAPGFSLSEKSSLLIATHSCSSLLTQNHDLLTVLRWRMNCIGLNASLVALSQPIGETENEMIRFLSPLLDALFEIWHDRETAEMAVFDAIVAVMRLCEDQRHAQASKLFDAYLKRFSFTSASTKILRCLIHYVMTDSDECNEKSRNSFKVMGSLFKIVVASEKCSKKFVDDYKPPKSFASYLKEFMKALVYLMADQRPRMTVQNTALKNIPTIIDLLNDSGACATRIICDFIVDLMDNFGQNIVTRERLGFIAQIVETKLFSLPQCRDQLLSPCLHMALSIIDLDNASFERAEFADRAAECASVIAAIIERLFPDATTHGEAENRELSSFILAVYRPLVQAMIRVIQDDRHTDDDARGHFFSVILALLDKMSAQMFGEYVEEMPFDIDKRDFLMEMVLMIRDLLNRNAFPATWRDMIMLQNKVIHKALKFVMSAVQSFFSNDNFCAEMWQEYMNTVVSFITQEGLDSKYEWLKQEDEDLRVQLRKAAAKDLRSMWFRLSPSQKLIYIPSMVGAFLKVSLVDDDDAREAIIPIFFDMMQTEYNTSSSRSFKEFASELVAQLDSIVGEHSATKAFKEQFRQLSIIRCQSDKDLMSNGGKELIDRIDLLLTHLIEYHDAASNLTECADILMSRALQLLKYYNTYNHEELYVKYIYKLYNLHMSYGHEIEAAKTLLRHAVMLHWDDRNLPEFMVLRSWHRGCSTNRQLKENLMIEAGKLLAEGEDWEDAIKVYKELMPVYENVIVDYAKLAELMKSIADLFTDIDQKERAYCYYYQVAFYGRGFPDYLNGHKFVYRSDKLEMHGDFMARIMKMFDNPEKVMTTDDCSHLTTAKGRYIQVFNIEPIGEGCSFDSVPTINPAIKMFYRHNDIKKFEYSKTEERKETKWTKLDEKSDFMRNWVVKRQITIEDTLPSDLRFSEIVSISEPIYLSPLQIAVETMKKKNRELNELATNVAYNSKYDLKLLSREILGVCQAAVMGGIKNYVVFLDEKCPEVCERGEQMIIMELTSLIIEQVEILEYCCWVYSNKSQGEETRLNKPLADAFESHRSFVELHFGKTRSRLPPNASIRLSKSDESDSNSQVGEISGMATLKSTKAMALGNAVVNLLSSNKRTSGTASPAAISNRSAPSFDNLSSALRHSFATSRQSSSHQKMALPSTPSIHTSSTPTSQNSDGIRLRTHHPHVSSMSSLFHSPIAPPLPPRTEADPNRTLKRVKHESPKS